MSNSEFDEEDLPLAQLSIATPSTAKTFGTLNIVFASLLLLCAVCTGLGAVMNTVMQPIMAKAVNDAKVQQDQMQKKLMDDLAKQEKAAKTPQEKAAIQSQAAAMKASPAMAPVPDMSKMFGFNQGKFLIFSIVDASTSFLLNTIMLISGIGLLRLREWGRVTAVWLAFVKVIRLVLLQGFNLMVIVPAMSKQMGEMFADIQKSVPPNARSGAPDFSQMAAAWGTMIGIMALGTLVLGLIYPALCLWFLTRPGVKAACQIR